MKLVVLVTWHPGFVHIHLKTMQKYNMSSLSTTILFVYLTISNIFFANIHHQAIAGVKGKCPQLYRIEISKLHIYVVA